MFYKASTSLQILLLLAVVPGLTGGATCSGSHGDPKRAHTRVELAKDYLQKRQLEAAVQEARRALELDPESAEAHHVLGMVDYLRAAGHFRLLEVDDCLTGVDAEALRREFDEYLLAADASFRAAVELDPEYAEAIFNRGIIAVHLEEYDRAVELYQQALAQPHRLASLALTRAHLGWAHFHRAEHALAAKELRQALQFSPEMCVAKYRLGRVYFAREEWNKALEQFQAVADDQACPMQEAQLYLIKTHRELGSTESEPALIEACVALAPRSCVAAACRAGE